jgi:oligoendopeptidase F
MSLPARDEVPERYRFDLDRIYASADDWERASEAFLDALEELEVLLDTPLSSAEDFQQLVDRIEDLHRQKQRLELYATLSRNVATDDEDAKARMARFQRLESRFEVVMNAVYDHLSRIGDEAAWSLLDSLPDDGRYAADLYRQSRYAIALDVADAVAAFDPVSETPTDVIVAAITEDLDPAPVERPDGEAVELTVGNVRSELSNPDRAYRRRVYETYRVAVDGFEATLTEALAGKIEAARAEAEVRGYDSVRERALRRRSYPESGLRCSLPESVHDTMLEAVRANLDPYHRSLEVRRNRLGVETLRPWDRDVPIVDSDPPAIEYEDAREYIIEALAPLGEDYAETVKAFFEDRRIDVFPTKSKRNDIPAYCPSSAEDGAYILANFREDVRTTFYICHELGHAMHVEHHRRGRPRYATCPRPVSEVPSILHELLLAERVLETDGPLADAARNRLLECLGGNLFESTMSAAFVHRMVTAVENDEAVTPARARDAWADLQNEFEAPVRFEERAGRNWLDGWTRELYSNYQYVLGAAGALAIRERLRAGDLSRETYRDVLSRTGERSSIESFRALGCDVTGEAFYERAIAAFDGYVDRIAP